MIDIVDNFDPESFHFPNLAVPDHLPCLHDGILDFKVLCDPPDEALGFVGLLVFLDQGNTVLDIAGYRFLGEDMLACSKSREDDGRLESDREGDDNMGDIGPGEESREVVRTRRLCHGLLWGEGVGIVID